LTDIFPTLKGSSFFSIDNTSPVLDITIRFPLQLIILYVLLPPFSCPFFISLPPPVRGSVFFCCLFASVTAAFSFLYPRSCFVNALPFPRLFLEDPFPKPFFFSILSSQKSPRFSSPFFIREHTPPASFSFAHLHFPLFPRSHFPGIVFLFVSFFLCRSFSFFLRVT